MDDFMASDDNGNFDEVEAQDEERLLLVRLFDNNIDDEDTLFALLEREQLPQLALQRHYTKEGRFDFIHGLLNILRRLLHVHDDVVDQWMGNDASGDDSAVLCIFSFIFNVIGDYYERLCVTEMVKYENSYSFSLYDYICSVMCSFAVTLNEEQLIIAEEVLFENLFSSNLIRAILASDIICFLCRTSESTITIDICYSIFKLLNEIYVEDFQMRDTEAKNLIAFMDISQTQDILLSLLNRVLAFMDDEEVEVIQKDFPLDDYVYIWKRISSAPVAAKVAEEQQEAVVYDKLCILASGFSGPQLATSIVDNFVKSTDEYRSLLCLRLLSNDTTKLLPHLNCRQMSDILKKVKQFFASDLHYRKQFVFPILRIINSLSASQEASYRKGKFPALLRGVLIILFKEVKDCFVSRQYYYSVLQNISKNSLFSSLAKYAAAKLQLKREFKLHLKHYMQGKFMGSEEREIYVSQLKKIYKDLSNEEEIDSEAVLADVFLPSFDWPNLSKRTPEVEGNDYQGNCKRHKAEGDAEAEASEGDPLVDAVNSTVFSNQLQSCIDMGGTIHSISSEEKEHLRLLASKLVKVVNNLPII